ncbi:glycosyltransferase, group 1 family protein [Cetobacterium somerae ATCC BAA-474]|uniref:Glycosyltransferase, group 1 family protein n=1 Tax=Cetobacterium somerae ATCC BAA-474 TaxID=1319815 RepID=U7V809_9FUSO|nr:glycosyltransferase [Cetobacterium somerae]ERT67842.1 glycosyltransferase, group 1 family protein [Cetobacterium somerae ATCC BAA-474]
MTLKSIIKKVVKKYLVGKVRTPFVKNINLDLTKNQKRVLISYIGYFSTANLNDTIGHTNLLESIQIINIFKELGCIIDIVDCNSDESLKFFTCEKYDIIFGFGEVFYEIAKLNPTAKKIIYVTENHPELSLKKETERNKYFYERTGKKIPLRRTGIYYKEEHFRNVDYAIIMGEITPFERYNIPIYDVFPTGFLNQKYIFKTRSLEESKKNFLWLGSNGAVHKGLDLLIEIFKKNPEITLHICGFNPEEKYLKIPKLKNIINYGRIDIQGDKFLELVDVCSYIILPSCSEGCATSVLTGMLHSLIPIVCEETGFSKLGENAHYLKDYKIEYLQQEILKLSLKNINDLKKNHEKVYKYARENFTINNFTKNLKNIIGEIINE